VALTLAIAVMRWRPFRIAVEGRSMLPALQPGEFLLAVRSRRLRRGALVVLEHPGRTGLEIVKRVAALPGEGDLAPNQLWVVGEAAEASTDSRVFGPVERSAIRGVVVMRYWPPSRAGRVR
jgi:nickel-type superoxide dismutase maturation protease